MQKQSISQTQQIENSSHSVTPYKNKSVPMNLSIHTAKTPKESNSKLKSNGIISKGDERLNLSVDLGLKNS
jgi:hypothetical protein